MTSKSILRFWFRWVPAAILAAWFALIASSHGMLIWAEVQSPGSSQGQATLSCTFFTGLGVANVSYWYDSQGAMGKAICPRLKDFR